MEEGVGGQRLFLAASAHLSGPHLFLSLPFFPPLSPLHPHWCRRRRNEIFHKINGFFFCRPYPDVRTRRGGVQYEEVCARNPH